MSCSLLLCLKDMHWVKQIHCLRNTNLYLKSICDFWAHDCVSLCYSQVYDTSFEWTQENTQEKEKNAPASHNLSNVGGTAPFRVSPEYWHGFQLTISISTTKSARDQLA